MSQTLQQFDRQLGDIKSCNEQILALADKEDWQAVHDMANQRDEKLQAMFPLGFDVNDEVTVEKIRLDIQDLLRANDQIIKQARGIRVKFMNEKILFNKNQEAIKAYRNTPR